MLEAFAAARLPPDVSLVVLQRPYAGRRLGVIGARSLDRHSAELGVGGRVVFPRNLSDEALVGVLQGAEALVQFSRYEGFGMPALEAAACGTPVVASDIAPLREVLGGAALHVPLCVDALSRALERITTDRGLATELRARGPERARRHSWESSARAHLELYREAASAH